jgi:ubiquinol oxidase
MPWDKLPATASSGSSPWSLISSTIPSKEHQQQQTNKKQPLDPSKKDLPPVYFSEANNFMVTLIKSTVLDGWFGDRHYARFYALETIARVPYFSYTSVLFLLETIGKWRRADYLKVHFAESWNELHHLLIMESLGGNEKFFDRFLAQHAAFAYYWVVCAFYLVNPRNAYNLNQHIEQHAFETYDTYLKENEEELRKLPAPAIAKQYYSGADMYMFDEFQVSEGFVPPEKRRRPVIESLYDVFCAIRDDEAEHVKTMVMLQDGMTLCSPNSEVCEVVE